MVWLYLCIRKGNAAAKPGLKYWTFHILSRTFCWLRYLVTYWAWTATFPFHLFNLSTLNQNHQVPGTKLLVGHFLWSVLPKNVTEKRKMLWPNQDWNRDSPNTSILPSELPGHLSILVYHIYYVWNLLFLLFELFLIIFLISVGQ